MPGKGSLGWPSSQQGEWTGIRCTTNQDSGPPAAGSWSRVAIDRQLGMCFITGTYVLGASITSAEVNWGQLPVNPAAPKYVVGGGVVAHSIVYLGTGNFYNTSTTIPVLIYYRPSDEKIVMVTTSNNETPYLSNLAAGAILYYNLAYAI